LIYPVTTLRTRRNTSRTSIIDPIKFFMRMSIGVGLSPQTHSFAPAAPIARIRLVDIFLGLAPVTRMGGRPLCRQSRQGLPLSPTVWAGFGNSADAKDQASLPLDGLLMDYPTPWSDDA
jgi:hypothetical protein